MNSLINVLELARKKIIKKIFWPSSIAVFGPDSPKLNTPQNSTLNPSSIYGITKLAGEKLCQYYYDKFDVDVHIIFAFLLSIKSKPNINDLLASASDNVWLQSNFFPERFSNEKAGSEIKNTKSVNRIFIITYNPKVHWKYIANGI